MMAEAGMMKRVRLWCCFLAAVAVLGAGVAFGGGGYGGEEVGRIECGLLDEISGIAASRRNAGVFWAHNDSGDGALIYAFDGKGRHLGIYELSGVRARDCEDIAVGPGPVEGADYIYLGDIGDNYSGWEDVRVYRVVEPEVDMDGGGENAGGTLEGVEVIRLKYEDGARDAETIMVDPVMRDIYIVSKRDMRSRVYCASYPQSVSEVGRLEFKCVLPWGLATAGDISRDGSAVVVRNYYTASIWKRAAEMKLWEAFANDVAHVVLRGEEQGEAICFAADGKGYYTTSEGFNQPVYGYGLPGDRTAEGETVFRDGFEGYANTDELLGGDAGYLNQWKTYGPGAVWLTKAHRRSGKQAVEIELKKVSGHTVTPVYYVGPVSRIKGAAVVGVEGYVSFENPGEYRLFLQNEVWTSTETHYGRTDTLIASGVQYNGKSGTWQYEAPAGVYHNLSTKRTYEAGLDEFHYFKLVVDYEAKEYVSFQFDKETWYFSDDLIVQKRTECDYAMHEFNMRLITYGDSSDVGAKVVLDDVVFTIEGP